MDPELLEQFRELLADGGMIACHATTRDQMLAELDGEARAALAARIQTHSWLHPGRILGVPRTFARAAEQFAVATST